MTKIEELRELDKSVKRPADVFAYIYGSIASLVLGAGMCLAMPSVIEGYMVLGIIVGVIGMGLMASTYFIRNAILRSRKAKYSSEILELSEKILEGENIA